VEMKTKTISVGTTSFQVEILTWRLPNKKVKCKPLDRNVQEREKHIHETSVEFKRLAMISAKQNETTKYSL
jgi:hypothetical protein